MNANPPPNPLEIQTEVRKTEAGDVAVVSVVGEVDLANAEELETALTSEPCQSASGVVLDLLDVPFMDSSGLRVLLLLRGWSNRAALVVAPGSPVERLLEFAEMTGVFPVRPHAEEAIAEVGGTAT